MQENMFIVFFGGGNFKQLQRNKLMFTWGGAEVLSMAHNVLLKYCTVLACVFISVPALQMKGQW